MKRKLVVLALILALTFAGCISGPSADVDSSGAGDNSTDESGSDQDRSDQEDGSSSDGEESDGDGEGNDEDRNSTENGDGTKEGENSSEGENKNQNKSEEANAVAVFHVSDDESYRVTLEVADTREERAKGLMYRKSLEENHGMVFVYENEAPRTFWMKNTYIPLDMIFVDANGTVLNVEHARPQPNASDSELERYHSDGEARFVIEVNRGFANRTGVGSGTKVYIDLNRSEKDE